jgi:hypothetical protein
MLPSLRLSMSSLLWYHPDSAYMLAKSDLDHRGDGKLDPLHVIYICSLVVNILMNSAVVSLRHLAHGIQKPVQSVCTLPSSIYAGPHRLPTSAYIYKAALLTAQDRLHNNSRLFSKA